jgi:CheY-like chemotaxis protein
MEYTPWRTLLIDDNFSNLEFAAALIENLGFPAAAAATDSDEAFAAMEDTSFDLVIVDMTMPGMSGFDVTKTIRQQEQEAHSEPMVIVAVSTETDSGFRQRAFQSGIYFSHTVFSICIENTLRRQFLPLKTNKSIPDPRASRQNRPEVSPPGSRETTRGLGQECFRKSLGLN